VLRGLRRNTGSFPIAQPIPPERKTVGTSICSIEIGVFPASQSHPMPERQQLELSRQRLSLRPESQFRTLHLDAAVLPADLPAKRCVGWASPANTHNDRGLGTTSRQCAL
jgi:hypothetical protein